MRPLNGYAQAQAYSENERLPIGGYVLKILDAKEVVNERGSILVISFDISEGDQKDFFANNYRAQTGEDKKWKGVYRLRVPKEDGTEQDNWTMRRFKTVMVAIEESNSGYHWNWDERSLKGKLIGGIFNNKEYDYNGRHGFFTNCYSLIAAEKIRSGKFEIPADTLLKPATAAPAGTPMTQPGYEGFMNIPDGADDEGLPFN